MKVYKASDGVQAVQTYKEMSDGNPCKFCDFFSLIVTDVNMPRMGGMEATE